MKKLLLIIIIINYTIILFAQNNNPNINKTKILKNNINIQVGYPIYYFINYQYSIYCKEKYLFSPKIGFTYVPIGDLSNKIFILTSIQYNFFNKRKINLQVGIAAYHVFYTGPDWDEIHQCYLPNPDYSIQPCFDIGMKYLIKKISFHAELNLIAKNSKGSSDKISWGLGINGGIGIGYNF